MIIGTLFIARWLAVIVGCSAGNWWRNSCAFVVARPPSRRSGARRGLQDAMTIVSDAAGAVAGRLFIVRWLAAIVSTSPAARGAFLRA